MNVVYGRAARVTGPRLQQAMADIQSNETLYFGRESNKRLDLERMQLCGVPIPALYTPQYVSAPTFRAFPIVGRADQHARARKLWQCNNARDVRIALRRGATHFLQWLDYNYEFRCHIIGDKCVKMSQKTGGAGNIRSFRYGWTFNAPTIENRDAVREAAKKAVKALELEYGAVDVIFNGAADARVLEVNTAPALCDTTLATYARHFKELYESRRT